MGNLLNMSGSSLLKKGGLLPSGYKQLEYIENTSDAYIDTGYVPNSDTSVEGQVSYTNVQIDISQGSIFGTRYEQHAPAYSLNLHVNQNGFRWDFGADKNIITNFMPTSNQLISFNNKVSHRSMVINGNSYAVSNSTFTTIRNMWLFKANVNDDDTTGPFAIMKMYYLSIWESDAPIRNFIPCINPKNVVGMYDTINDVFYSSPNGTAFIAGTEV